MKKLVSLVLAVVMVLCVFAGCTQTEQEKDNGTLYMYTEAGFPPFEYLDGSKVVGVDVEIGEYIAKELGMKLEVKNVSFEAAITAVASKDDAIGLAGLTVTEERLLSLDFSTSYWTANLGIIYKKGALTKGADGKIKMDVLVGKNVGVQTGTSGDFAVQDFEGAKAKQYDNALIAAQAIGNGCDYVVIDNIVAENIVANAKNLNLEFANLESEPEYFALAVKKGNKELMDKINPIIEKLVKEGKIDEFMVKHSVK